MAASDNDFTVGTFNVAHRRSSIRIRRDILHLIEGYPVDVLCLQEVGVSHFDAISNIDGWGKHAVGYTPGQPGGRADNPLIYNTDTVKAVNAGFRVATPPTRVEYDTAGGADVEEKAVVWARFRHRATGAKPVVFNAHAIPGVEAHGAPDMRRPRRLHVYHEMMTTLAAMTKFRAAHNQLVFIGGDFNVDYRHDKERQDGRFPYRALGAHGVTASYSVLGAPPGGTCGNRLIDYVMWKRDPQIRCVDQKIVRLGSDHAAVLATFRFLEVQADK